MTDSAPLSGRGAQLRAKREQDGRSLTEVARALHLSVYQVEALENDEHDALPGDTYVRGYLRNYAGLLKIPFDDIAVTDSTPQDDIAEPNGQMDPQGASGSSESVHRRLTPAFIMLAALFLALVWFWQRPAIEEPAAPPAPPTAAGGSEVSPPAVADAVATPTPSGTIPQPNFGADERPESGDYSAWYQDNPGASQQPPSPAGSLSTPPLPALVDPRPPPNQITFIAAAPSWLDIRNSDGSRLVSRRVAANERLIVVGSPPFSVFIGDAAGAAVEYRGAPVPFTAARDRRFARFIVGAPQ